MSIRLSEWKRQNTTVSFILSTFRICGSDPLCLAEAGLFSYHTPLCNPYPSLALAFVRNLSTCLVFQPHTLVIALFLRSVYSFRVTCPLKMHFSWFFVFNGLLCLN